MNNSTIKFTQPTAHPSVPAEHSNSYNSAICRKHFDKPKMDVNTPRDSFDTRESVIGRDC